MAAIRDLCRATQAVSARLEVQVHATLSHWLEQSVERGAWSVERGAWSVERGAWSVERGAWSVERGAWSVERSERSTTLWHRRIDHVTPGGG
jgi:hypothetical protein